MSVDPTCLQPNKNTTVLYIIHHIMYYTYYVLYMILLLTPFVRNQKASSGYGFLSGIIR